MAGIVGVLGCQLKPQYVAMSVIGGLRKGITSQLKIHLLTPKTTDMKKLTIIILLSFMGMMGSETIETTNNTEQLNPKRDVCAVEWCTKPAKPGSYFCAKHSQ